MGTGTGAFHHTHSILALKPDADAVRRKAGCAGEGGGGGDTGKTWRQ